VLLQVKPTALYMSFAIAAGIGRACSATISGLIQSQKLSGDQQSPPLAPPLALGASNNEELILSKIQVSFGCQAAFNAPGQRARAHA